MKLWPTDPDSGDSDRFVAGLIIALTVFGIILAYIFWGH